MKWSFTIDLKKYYAFNRSLLSLSLDIKIDNILGKLFFPDNITGDLYGFKDIISYTFGDLKEEDEIGYISSDFLCINKFYCEFYPIEQIDSQNFYQELEKKISSIILILNYYPIKFDKAGVDISVKGDNGFNISAKDEEGKPLINHELHFNLHRGKANGINKYTLLRLLNLANYKATIEFVLLQEAKDLLRHNDYRHSIINCCSICELVLSKLVINRFTRRGTIEEDINTILDQISGLYSLKKIAKKLGVDIIHSIKIYDVLTELRNNAAHRGISPSKEDCLKYVKVCEELLNKSRIMFYEIE